MTHKGWRVVKPQHNQFPCRNSYSLDEISLSCMDTHDGFLYSPTFAYMRKAFCPCEKLLSRMTTLVLGIIHLKVGEKESIMSQSLQDKESHPRGRNFNQGLAKPCPWLKFLPEGEISLSCMDTHKGFL